ncbi:hypothetical protein CLOSYM_00586 [[Clostridium] symbiosum ATCC 14940]|uniref:Uncharacterized protein n=1 Tax=[Clostridium] symbiosum ATCC 14940 TaxID=411472 RepID=A0ABC9U2X2_CLOSY|nr:hypothetical protein CLOSYM_00586 [[Clostridium] symbiosum ATCC 14940]
MLEIFHHLPGRNTGFYGIFLRLLSQINSRPLIKTATIALFHNVKYQ